jgi:hypothetical protein
MALAVKSTAPQFARAVATGSRISVARPAGKLAAIAALLGISVLSNPLLAAGLNFSVSYSAPPECPSNAQFAAAVMGRANGASAVERPNALLALDVALTKRADGVAGTLVIEFPDGWRSRRDAFGADCAEVFESLAVIAAISLDGYRATREPAELAAANAAASTANAAASTASTTTSAAAPATANSTATPPPPATAQAAERNSAPPSPPRETTPTAGTRWHPGLYAGAAWESAVAPRAPFGVAAGFDLVREPRGMFWPGARLGVLVTGASTIERGAASADFQLVTGRLAACPLGFGKPRRASIHACIELDAGALRAEGEGVENASPEWLSWLAAGLAARGELALAPWLSLEATASGRALARHYQLVFTATDSSEDLVVYDMPALSLGVTAGVVARLP